LYLVPDVTTGKETFITFVIVVEIALVGGLIIIMVRRRTAPSCNFESDDLDLYHYPCWIL